MNSQEHKAEAETLLQKAKNLHTNYNWEEVGEEVTLQLAMARVHATLATVPDPLESIQMVKGTLPPAGKLETFEGWDPRP